MEYLLLFQCKNLTRWRLNVTSHVHSLSFLFDLYIWSSSSSSSPPFVTSSAVIHLLQSRVIVFSKLFQIVFVRFISDYSIILCSILWAFVTYLSSQPAVTIDMLFEVLWKGKAVPLQAWSGLEGSRNLRFPDLMTTVQDGGKVVSLTHWPTLTPRNTPRTHFC